MQAVTINNFEDFTQKLKSDSTAVYSIHVGLLETLVSGGNLDFLRRSTADLRHVGLRIKAAWRMHNKMFPSAIAMKDPTLVYMVESLENVYKWFLTGRCYDSISRRCRGLPRIDLYSSIATIDADRSPDDLWLCACAFPFRNASIEEYKGFKRDYVLSDVSRNKSTYGISNPEALAPLFLIRLVQDENSPIKYPPYVPEYVPEDNAPVKSEEVKKDEEGETIKTEPNNDVAMTSSDQNGASSGSVVLPGIPPEISQISICHHNPPEFGVHIDLTVPMNLYAGEINVVDTFIRNDVVNAIWKVTGNGARVEWRVPKEPGMEVEGSGNGSTMKIEIYTPESGIGEAREKYEREYVPLDRHAYDVDLQESFVN